MTCKELIDFLDRYHAGELEEGTRERFEQHLNACPPCKDYLESYQATIELGRRVCCDEHEVPKGMPEDLVAVILKEIDNSSK